MKIAFVTGNSNKVAEVSRALSRTAASFELTRGDVDLPECQGEPEEVAREKCRAAAERLNGPVLVEDTSLCFRALDELPGVYVKWFLKKTGRQGLVNMLAAYQDKVAFAQCIFGLSLGPGHPVHLFVGRTQGIIVPERGPKDSFGWDPIFQPDQGDGRTYAEMSKDEKNEISHRGKALKQVIDFISNWKPEEEQVQDAKKAKPCD